MSDIARPTIEIPEAWARSLAEVLFRAKSVDAAYVVDLRVGGVMGPRLVVRFVNETNPQYDSDDAALLLEQLRKTFGELVEVFTTNEPGLLSACRVSGRRLF